MESDRSVWSANMIVVSSAAFAVLEASVAEPGSNVTESRTEKDHLLALLPNDFVVARQRRQT